MRVFEHFEACPAPRGGDTVTRLMRRVANATLLRFGRYDAPPKGVARKNHIRHVRFFRRTFSSGVILTHPFYSSDTLLISYLMRHFIGFHLTPILSHFDSREVF
jgi:hypothetical protein